MDVQISWSGMLLPSECHHSYALVMSGGFTDSCGGHMPLPQPPEGFLQPSKGLKAQFMVFNQNPEITIFSPQMDSRCNCSSHVHREAGCPCCWFRILRYSNVCSYQTCGYSEPPEYFCANFLIIFTIISFLGEI